MSMEKFFTRQTSNEGIKVPLYYPGTNEPSGEWIRVRGMESDVFRKAEHEAKRKAVAIASLPEEERDAAHLELKRALVASLVIDWSFEQECTLENVINFFREAPQIEDAINTIASKRHLFFVKESSGSVNTPDSSSS